MVKHKPLEVVLSHTRIVRWCRALNQESNSSQGDYLPFREQIEPCITPRGESYLRVMLERKLHHI
jgi:hypothetical protein